MARLQLVHCGAPAIAVPRLTCATCGDRPLDGDVVHKMCGACRTLLGSAEARPVIVARLAAALRLMPARKRST